MERAQPANHHPPLPWGEAGVAQSAALRRLSRLAVQSQPWGRGRGNGIYPCLQSAAALR
jgi:hypothetical protein